MLFILTLSAILISFFYLSIFEWTLHRYVMHEHLKRFSYPFRKHTLTHHRIFRADDSYRLADPKDKKAVPMAWWCGPALVATTTAPSLLLSFLFGAWWISAGVFIASVFYFTAYEYMHWCMHIPKNRPIERTSVFRMLNEHHLLHHYRMHRNLNVVFPFADFIFGTLITCRDSAENVRSPQML